MLFLSRLIALRNINYSISGSFYYWDFQADAFGGVSLEAPIRLAPNLQFTASKQLSRTFEMGLGFGLKGFDLSYYAPYNRFYTFPLYLQMRWDLRPDKPSLYLIANTGFISAGIYDYNKKPLIEYDIDYKPGSPNDTTIRTTEFFKPKPQMPFTEGKIGREFYLSSGLELNFAFGFGVQWFKLPARETIECEVCGDSYYNDGDIFEYSGATTIIDMAFYLGVRF